MSDLGRRNANLSQFEKHAKWLPASLELRELILETATLLLAGFELSGQLHSCDGVQENGSENGSVQEEQATSLLFCLLWKAKEQDASKRRTKGREKNKKKNERLEEEGGFK